MNMFEMFTDRARKVMALANQEAQRFNHEYIGTEHILLGLLNDASGTGATILRNLDVDIKKLHREVVKLVKSGPDMPTLGKLPQTPRAKSVVESAIDEAQLLKHKYVGTEHILLGLLREGETLGGQVLGNLGLNLEIVRQEVLNLVGMGVDEIPRKHRVDPREHVSFEDVIPLTLLIDPGDATAEELSELFLELSTLYRMAGGSGVNFTIIDAKEPAVA